MDAALFEKSAFAPLGHEQWMGLARKALKGADFDDTLVSSTDDGLRVEPIYERRADARVLKRQAPERPWHIVQRIDDPDVERARAQLLRDLDGGATGISLVFEGAPNAFGYGLPAEEEALNTLLEGIALDSFHLRTDVHPASRKTMEWLVAIIARKRLDPASLSLSFGIDPAAVFAGTGRLRMSIEALHASMPQALGHFFAMQVPGVLLEADGRIYHNAGATEAQELGAMIASAISHLRMFEEARQPLVYAAPHIGFCLSVDQNQLLSTAKLRALRLLWSRAQEACGIEAAPTQIHAETSLRMMTRRDPETNILRSTIACFAAAVGGADSISIVPHTVAHGLADRPARRLARNTQLVLAHEAAIGFVADPSAGSGGVEALTDGLCATAWDEFRRIENEGGLLASLRDGKFQQRVVEAREKRALEYADGKRAIIGTTLFSASEERHVLTLYAKRRAMPTDGALRCEKLDALRMDETFGDQT